MFRSACGIVLPVFSAVMVLLNLKTILQTDWHRLSMLHWNVPYLLFSGIVSAVIAGVVLALLYRLFPGHCAAAHAPSKLARMVLENQWYEQAERTKQDGFFQGFTQFRYKNEDSPFSTDVLPHGKRAFIFKWKSRWGKYQEPLLHLETKLESGLYCELVSRELRDGYGIYPAL